MREIKFRAWDEGKKEMHYDFEFIRSGSDGSDWIVFKSDKQPLHGKPHPFENPYFCQQLKIMQWVGYDNLYEGDIVKAYRRDDAAKENPVLSEVTFLNGCFMLFNCTTHEFYRIWQSNYEVVGNIYENPELLK